MNILFNAYDQTAKIYCKIAYELNNRSDFHIDTFYFLIDTTVYEQYIRKNAPSNSVVIHRYADFDKNTVKKYDDDTFSAYEKKYGIPNFGLLAVSERFFTFENNPNYKDIFCWHCETVEQIFEKYPIDFVVSMDISGFYSIPLKNAAERRKIPFVYVNMSRLPRRIKVSTDIFLTPLHFRETLDDLKNRQLTEEEYSKARELVLSYREKNQKPPYHREYSRVPPFASPKKIVKKLKDYIFGDVKKYASLSDVLKYSTYFRKFRLYYKNTFYSKLFEEPDYSKPYIYFPLQYQPEIAIDTMGAFYTNQSIIVDFVSKSMPARYYLYVKDHPVMFGLRPISFYKGIKKIPNVKLIHSSVDNYSLLKNSAGVVVISSTAGFEGYILGKPVILFGKVFYQYGKGVYNVSDIWKLPEILKDAVENYVPDEDAILKLCYAYYASTHPGLVAPPSVDPEITSDENIGNLVSAIIKEYKYLKLSK